MGEVAEVVGFEAQPEAFDWVQIGAVCGEESRLEVMPVAVTLSVSQTVALWFSQGETGSVCFTWGHLRRLMEKIAYLGGLALAGLRTFSF